MKRNVLVAAAVGIVLGWFAAGMGSSAQSVAVPDTAVCPFVPLGDCRSGRRGHAVEPVQRRSMDVRQWRMAAYPAVAPILLL